MNKWIKIILPDGTEKYVRKVEFGDGFFLTHNDKSINISNINNADYEFAKNIFEKSQLDLDSNLLENVFANWKYAFVYNVINKSNSTYVDVGLPINTVWAISQEMMNPDLSDVIVVDENGNIVPWYCNETNYYGEFNIIIGVDIPVNTPKKFYVLFGNKNCVGVFKKPSNIANVKLPMALSRTSKYKIYPLTNQNTTLKWNIVYNNTYVDVSTLNNNEIFVVERSDDGTRHEYFNYQSNVNDVIKLQHLSDPSIQESSDVIVGVVRHQIANWPYSSYFGITNEDKTNTIDGPVCIEFNSVELISSGYLQPNGSDLRVALLDAYGNIIKELDYYIENNTLGTNKTKLWIDLEIPPNNTVYVALLFGKELVNDESTEDVFNFGSNFKTPYLQPPMTMESLPGGVYKFTIHNTTNTTLNHPIKLPVNASSQTTGYLFTRN